MSYNYQWTVSGFLLLFTSLIAAQTVKVDQQQEQSVKLFLGGDVMSGRGIDQAMPHPVDLFCMNLM